MYEEYAMSEKKQGTARAMQLRMQQRYDDNVKHKHNKNHQSYRKHCKTYPVLSYTHIETEGGESTGDLRALKLSRVRTRPYQGSFH
jgi:hypothetical protein